jgi:hypothetical protein
MTHLVSLPNGKFIYYLSMSYRAAGKRLALVKRGSSLGEAAEILNGDPRLGGFEFVAMVGAPKDAAELFVLETALGDLDMEVQYIDDVTDLTASCRKCVRYPDGEKVKFPKDMKGLNAERGTPRAQLERSGLTVQEAMDELGRRDGFKEFVTEFPAAGQGTEGHHLLRPILSALSQQFIGSYRDLIEVKRVEEAVKEQKVTAEAVAAELRKIALEHPRVQREGT